MHVPKVGMGIQTAEVSFSFLQENFFVLFCFVLFFCLFVVVFLYF